MPSMTITTTAPLAQRLATAMGRELGLKNGGGFRDATADEIKTATIAHLRRIVHKQERLAADEALNDSTFDPT